MMTAIQGIVAAGTVAYLTREVTWEKVALGINHLFYLVGSASLAAGTEIPFFALTAKTVFVLTPFVLTGLLFLGPATSSDDEGRSSRFKSETFDSGMPVPRPKNPSVNVRLGVVFHIAAAVSTVVLVAFGRRAYGIGFLSIAALDVLTRSRNVARAVRWLFNGLATVPAFLSFWSYGLNLRTQSGVQLMLLTSLAVFVPRIYKLFKLDSDPSYGYRGYASSYRSPSSRSTEEEQFNPVPPPSQEKNFPEIANLMGDLPHLM